MLASLLWALHSSASARRWRRAARDTARAQRDVLLGIVRANAGTEFGRAHGFERIDSVAAFQERVPLRSFDDFAPFIERIAAGEQNVLTSERVVRFGVTSGSMAPSKLIPYTPSLLAAFREGIDAFVWQLFRTAPRAFLGKAYWSVTPAGARPRRSSGGIPIGFDDEEEYLDPLSRRLVAATMAVPASVAREQDIDTFLDATLQHLVRARALSWISIWNPTFFLLLLARLSKEGPTPAEIWPKLRLISCWADGAAAESVPVLKRAFPDAIIQPKGLIATEAFVSFPWHAGGSALAIRSHFFEFEDAGGAIRLAHELREGERYAVVVTTQGGLYRNRMHDLVDVVGRVDGCPLLRFAGRADKVVDLRGEKLNEVFVANALASFAARFKMLAPNEQGDGYTLFVQGDAAIDIDAVDLALRASYHYDYCRRLGQLAPCRLFRIDPSIDPAARYLEACVAQGQRLGDVKPASLHAYRGWAGVFAEKA